MIDSEEAGLRKHIDIMYELLKQQYEQLGQQKLELDMWHDRAEDVRNRLSAKQDENAKLRELVRDLLHHIEYPPCEGCLSEMSCAGDLSQCDEYFDWLKPRARKLGVEVDE